MCGKKHISQHTHIHKVYQYESTLKAVINEPST